MSSSVSSEAHVYFDQSEISWIKSSICLCIVSKMFLHIRGLMHEAAFGFYPSRLTLQLILICSHTYCTVLTSVAMLTCVCFLFLPVSRKPLPPVPGEDTSSCTVRFDLLLCSLVHQVNTCVTYVHHAG